MTQKGAGIGKSKIPHSSASASKSRLATKSKSKTGNQQLQQRNSTELPQETEPIHRLLQDSSSEDNSTKADYNLWKNKYTNMTVDEIKQSILELDPTNIPSYIVKAILNVLKSKLNDRERCDFVLYLQSIIDFQYSPRENSTLMYQENCKKSKNIEFNKFDFLSNLHLLFEKQPVNTIWSQDNKEFRFYSDIDDETIHEQMKFLKSLNLRELLTLHNYSYSGDSLVNTMLRDNIDILKLKIRIKKFKINFVFLPQIIQYYETRHSLYKQLDENNSNYEPSKALIKSLSTELRAISRDNQKVTHILSTLTKTVVFKTEFYIYLCKKYKKDLNHIFRKAPLLKKQTVLYRGVDQDYNKSTRNIHEGFISTSTSLAEAKAFTRTDNGFLYRYIAPKGLPLIMLCLISNFPGENEVLLSDGQIYDVKRIHKSKHYTMVDIELRPHIITRGVIKGEKSNAQSFSKSPTQTSSPRLIRAKSING